MSSVCFTYRVRGQAQQGQILAWVSPQSLTPLDADLLKNLKKAAERKKTVDALIKQRQVVMGMTPDEVGKSLGKPKKKTNKTDKDGTQQIWEYIKYVSIPQQVPSYVNGNLVYSTIYVQKPSGTLTVNFINGIVSSLEQSEGISSGSEVQIVVTPVNVYW